MLGEGILKGLAETARNFAGSFVSKERLTTVEYPEERLPLPEASRNFPFLVYDGSDWEKGLRCVACQICEKECPPKCIYIEKSKDKKPDFTGKPQIYPAKFDIDISVCMSCQICVEVCPFEAIKMNTEYELSTDDRFGGLLLDRQQLAKPNEYYHQIHPTEATEVDARLAEEKAKAEAKAKADAAKADAAKAEAAAKAKAAADAAAKAGAAPAKAPEGGTGTPTPGAVKPRATEPVKAVGKEGTADPSTAAARAASAQDDSARVGLANDSAKLSSANAGPVKQATAGPSTAAARAASAQDDSAKVGLANDSAKLSSANAEPVKQATADPSTAAARAASAQDDSAAKNDSAAKSAADAAKAKAPGEPTSRKEGGD